MQDLDRKYFGVSGVYAIKDVERDRIYVGSSFDLYKRINSHKNALLKGQHINNFLNNHVKSHGIDCLSVEILETIDSSKDHKYLLDREQYYLDIYFSEKCFNAHHNVTFFNDNPEARKHLRKIQKLNWINNRNELLDIVGKNLIKAQEAYRIKLLDPTYIKISPNKGKTASLETKIKQSESAFKRGRHDSILKEIYQYDLNGNYIKIFKCANDAIRDVYCNDIRKAANIRDCLYGNRDCAYGFIWKYYRAEKLNLKFTLENKESNEKIDFLSLKNIGKFLEMKSSSLWNSMNKGYLIKNKYRIYRNEQKD